MSQSLLNEVLFPTESERRKGTMKTSQSLLNEVLFPTDEGSRGYNLEGGVAIPFK